MGYGRAGALLLAVGAGACGLDTTSPAAHQGGGDGPLPSGSLQALSRSRFLGGNGVDVVDDIHFLASEDYVVVGGTSSTDFPTTDGSALDPTAPADCPACPFDAYIALFDRHSETVRVHLFSTPGYDRFTSVTFQGNTIWVAGSAGAMSGIPGWRGGAHPERGEQDGVVCALDLGTFEVEQCRYLPGDGVGDLYIAMEDPIATTIVQASEVIHLDPEYAAALAGRHRSTPAGDDVLVASIIRSNAPGLGLRWATFVGGSGDERGTPAVHTHWGSSLPVAYVLTETSSSDAPTPLGISTLPSDGQAAYVARLSLDGRELLFGSYLGGAGEDRVRPGSIATDMSTFFVGLTTTSTDLPTTAGAAQPQHGGNGGTGCGDGDVWLARLRTTGAGLDSILAATYLGGSGGEELGGLEPTLLDPDRLMITGTTYSTDFPLLDPAQGTLAGAPCATTAGNGDAFVTHVDFELQRRASTYLGGGQPDRGIAVRTFADRVLVVGDTASPDFPLVADGTFGGARDGFVAEYGDLPIMPPPIDAGIPDAPPGLPDLDGPFCGCGSSGSPAGAVAPALLVLAALLRRRRDIAQAGEDDEGVSIFMFIGHPDPGVVEANDHLGPSPRHAGLDDIHR